jgi:hypothetical protein
MPMVVVFVIFRRIFLEQEFFLQTHENQQKRTRLPNFSHELDENFPRK